MTKELEKLYTLVNSSLLLHCPYLSGNMLNSIALSYIHEDSIRLRINAKFYDVNKFKKDGIIEFTGENHNGITNYAMWVNEFGGFFSRNNSMYWVNRAVYDAVQTIANEIGATVINELPL